MQKPALHKSFTTVTRQWPGMLQVNLARTGSGLYRSRNYKA